MTTKWTNIKYSCGCGKMSKSFLQDHKGQLYTIEAVLAAGLMLSAVFFISASTPATVTPGQDFAKVQLKKYGQDVLMLLSYNEKELAVGELEYTLYREHDPDTWGHDEDVSNITTLPDGDWTASYLYIDYDVAGENRTVRFKLHDPERDDPWRNPSEIDGALYAVSYASPGSRFMILSDNDFLTFPHEGRMLVHTINMAWFKDAEEGVSTPVLVWVDIEPENRDDVLEIVRPELEGENELLQYVIIGQGSYVNIRKDPAFKPGGNWRINGEGIRDIDGIQMQELGDDEFRFTFDEKGGYAITWGPGASFAQHSDPVFVCVGKPGIKESTEISPLEAAIRGGLSLDKLNETLHSYIPENVEFNLYFYNSTGEIIHINGGEMKITNGNPTTEAVTVNVPVFATIDGTNYATYEAKLVLWYK